MRFQLILFLLIFAAALPAQTKYVPPCQSDALDTTFQGIESRDHIYTLAINLRNISVETCFIDSQGQGSGVSTHDSQHVRRVGVCYYCQPGSQKPLWKQINLAPGESVHQIHRWNTLPVDPAQKCVLPAEINWGIKYELKSFFRLASPSLLKPICSQMETEDYAAGQFLPEKTQWPLPGWRTPVVHWANDEDASYSREHVPLSVSVDDPDHVLLRNADSCPRLFVRVRDADPAREDLSRLTRVDELLNVNCKEEASGALTMKFDAAYAITQSDGEYTLDASFLAESEGFYHLVNTTDKLHLSMVDGKFIRRNWSAPVDGVAVSLSLEKDVYGVGSAVPFHIAVENFNSPDTIAVTSGEANAAARETNVTVELQTPTGLQIISPSWLDWECRHYLMPGLVFPVKLNGPAFKPGIYKAVAVWKPSKNGNCGHGRPADYFTVRSRPVIFRIIEPRHPGVYEEPGSAVKK